MSLQDTVNRVFNFFRSRGWSEQASATITGYLYEESNLNPNAFNPAGGGRGAQGIAQWRGPRITRFEQMFGTSIRGATLEQQLHYVDWELRNTESTSGRLLRTITNARDSVLNFMRSFGRGTEAEMRNAVPRALQGVNMALSGAGGGSTGGYTPGPREGESQADYVRRLRRESVNLTPEQRQAERDFLDQYHVPIPILDGIVDGVGGFFSALGYILTGEFWQRAVTIVIAVIIIGIALYAFVAFQKGDININGKDLANVG